MSRTSSPFTLSPFIFRALFFMSLVIFTQSPASTDRGQDSVQTADSLSRLQEQAVKIYITCPPYSSACDQDYFRTELGFVNFVRDRKEAQVEVLISTLSTGGGGTEYTFSFIGRLDFHDVNDTLTFSTQPADTKEHVRRRMLRTLKLGLIRYAARTPLASEISIDYAHPSASAKVADKWSHWVFSLSSNGYFDGQRSYRSLSTWSEATINRITEDRKVLLSFYMNYSQDTYEIDETTEVMSVSRGKGFSSGYVMGMGDHWSWKVSGDVSTSTYSNSDLSAVVVPSLEYSIFPYSESTRRLYRIDYALSYRYNKYHEVTLYGKEWEHLSGQSLRLGIDFTEPWGSSSISLRGFHYFHDFNKFEVTLYGSMNIRVVEGLSLRLNGNFAKIRNQLSLPAGGASKQEILLRQRELETSYRYWLNFGVTYSFGSIFNNIVNPRFGTD